MKFFTSFSSGLSVLAIISSLASASPFQANSPPALHKRFGRGGDTIRGVNLGGWLVIEPWITPSLFEQFVGSPTDRQAVDEWTFCEKLGKRECSQQLKKHWDEWVTESDIQTLASYGINHVRIPIGYWAFSENANEPFVQGQVEYLEKAIGWAKDAGINVILDLHGAPDSQNGFDNSGRKGDINWLHDQSSADRTLDALTKMAKIAEKHKDTVDILQYVNEPANWGLDMNKVVNFYNRAYDAIRNIYPDVVLSLHDSFLPLEKWHELRNKDWQNTMMDTHIYHVFVDEIINLDEQGHLDKAKNDGDSIAAFNPTLWTVTGEWSLATSDCAKWLNGFGVGARWDGTRDNNGPQCPGKQNCQCSGDAGGNDASQFSDEYKDFLGKFARAQMSAYERGVGWIFWNFKTEEAPQWSYMEGVEQGWIPKF